MNTITAKPEWAQSTREKRLATAAAAGLPLPGPRYWLWASVALAVIGGGLAAMQFAQPADVAMTTAEPAAPVMQLNSSEVTTITPQLLTRTIRVAGSLSPQRRTDLTSQVAGRVESVPLRPGDIVAEGDLLVQIDTLSLRLQLEQQRSTADATRAQLVLAETQLERMRVMIERGLSPSSGIDEAASTVAAQRAGLVALEQQVAAAEIALRDASVVAPFDGVVSSRSVEPGQTVSAGAPLLSLVDMSTMEMEAAGPLSAGAHMVPGQKVTLTVEGLAGRTFEGVVARVNPLATEGTRTLPVYITLANPERLLRGGMFAIGEIVVAEQANALAVPAAAIREDAEGNHVLRLEDGLLVRQEVEPGATWNQVVEVTAGLAVGDIVVDAPLPELTAGDQLQMVDF